MTAPQSKTIEIGDTIRFRAITRWSDKPAIRKVNGLVNGAPTVRYGGWSAFVVHPHEVIEVITKRI